MFRRLILYWLKNTIWLQLNHNTNRFLVGGIKEANLDNVYLCSIFSNLLNNALEASKYCTTNPYIELKSSIQLGNLVITCRNSMPQVIRKKDDPNHNHGYGLHIIKDLSNLLAVISFTNMMSTILPPL